MKKFYCIVFLSLCVSTAYAASPTTGHEPYASVINHITQEIQERIKTKGESYRDDYIHALQMVEHNYDVGSYFQGKSLIIQKVLENLDTRKLVINQTKPFFSYYNENLARTRDEYPTKIVSPDGRFTLLWKQYVFPGTDLVGREEIVLQDTQKNTSKVIERKIQSRLVAKLAKTGDYTLFPGADFFVMGLQLGDSQGSSLVPLLWVSDTVFEIGYGSKYEGELYTTSQYMHVDGTLLTDFLNIDFSGLSSAWKGFSGDFYADIYLVCAGEKNDLYGYIANFPASLGADTFARFWFDNETNATKVYETQDPKFKHLDCEDIPSQPLSE